MNVQYAITQRYGQLTDAITHDPSGEKAVLAPNFSDRSKAKLNSFEYDPVTVLVQKMSAQPDGVYVNAEYVGVHGHNVTTVDHWEFMNGQWFLVSRR
jgi:hypothetical protein